MRWAVLVTRMETMRNSNSILVGLRDLSENRRINGRILK
jgi:hypothetical protein